MGKFIRVCGSSLLGCLIFSHLALANSATPAASAGRSVVQGMLKPANAVVDEAEGLLGSALNRDSDTKLEEMFFSFVNVKVQNLIQLVETGEEEGEEEGEEGGEEGGEDEGKEKNVVEGEEGDMLKRTEQSQEGLGQVFKPSHLVAPKLLLGPAFGLMDFIDCRMNIVTGEPCEVANKAFEELSKQVTVDRVFGNVHLPDEIDQMPGFIGELLPEFGVHIGDTSDVEMENLLDLLKTHTMDFDQFASEWIQTGRKSLDAFGRGGTVAAALGGGLRGSIPDIGRSALNSPQLKNAIQLSTRTAEALGGGPTREEVMQAIQDAGVMLPVRESLGSLDIKKLRRVSELIEQYIEL